MREPKRMLDPDGGWWTRARYWRADAGLCRSAQRAEI